MFIECLTLLMNDRIICDALNWLSYLICNILFCELSYVKFTHLFMYICVLSVNLWMDDKHYSLYRLSNILSYLICDDWMVVDYCVKPLDHTIHTQIWISRGNRLSHKYLNLIFWNGFKVWILNPNGFGNEIGLNLKSIWKGVLKIKVILNNLI